MENIKSIQTYLENKENSNIEQKNKSIGLPVSLIILAIALTLLGISPITGTYLSMALITTGIIVLVTAIVMLSSMKGSDKYCYVYTPAHETLKHWKIYIDDATVSELKAAIPSQNFAGLANQKAAFQSSHCLDIYGSPKGSFYLAQTLHFESYALVPVTEIMILEGANANHIAKFIANR
ncbi:MAG: hypothetical protein MJZ76_04370 [Bacteroidales bacterium]|nr:hypothetical protein [Bacteroidales bacterium]